MHFHVPLKSLFGVKVLVAAVKGAIVSHMMVKSVPLELLWKTVAFAADIARNVLRYLLSVVLEIAGNGKLMAISKGQLRCHFRHIGNVK